jgi:glycine oxidase
MKNNITTDALIIGGGIVGLTTALELTKQGLSVVIVDDTSRQKASWAGAGIISPLYPWKYSDVVNELSIKSQQLYPQLAAEIKEHTGLDIEYLRSGLLMLDEFDSTTAKKWLSKWNIDYQHHNNSALFDIAQVRNSKILPALQAYLKKMGVRFIDTTIQQLNIKHNKVLGAHNIIAKHTIICGGAWSEKLVDVDVYPMKGQIITIFDANRSLPHIVLKNGNYIVPRKDGVVLVGATMEDIGFDNSLDKSQELFEFLLELYPQFKDHTITHHWCGFRPASDTIIIEKSDKYDNLFINTGHFRNGLNTAPQSAKIIRDLIK